jgi:quinol monooxygenase YgiN
MSEVSGMDGRHASEQSLSQNDGGLVGLGFRLTQSEIAAGAHPIYRTTEFRVTKESAGRCVRAIQEFVSYVRRCEPGTLLYLSLQDKEDPTHFIHLMAFANSKSMASHGNSPANQEYITVLYPEVEGGVVISDFDVVAMT